MVHVPGLACLTFSNVSHETILTGLAPAHATRLVRPTLISNDRTHPDIPLGSWLAALPDERLTQLLELRPDLAQPPPGSIAALAARAQARQSVKAATDELDFLRLAVFDALLVLQADTAPVPIVRLLAVIGDRAAQADVLGALADLKQRALAWGETAVRVATDAGTALPWHPGQVTLEEVRVPGISSPT